MSGKIFFQLKSGINLNCSFVYVRRKRERDAMKGKSKESGIEATSARTTNGSILGASDDFL